MATSRKLDIVITVSNAQLKRALATTEGSFKKMSGKLGGLFTPSALGITALIGSFVGLTREATSLETTLVKVDKVADLGKGLPKFKKDLIALSNTIPSSTKELGSFAEAAAQMGVRGNKNLLKFAETMKRLSVSTNIVGEEGARSMARILDLSGEGAGKIDKLGSSLVALGNNFALTEGEILHMQTRLSQTTAAFKLSAKDTAGLASAMASMGVRTAVGTTVIGRSLRKMQEALTKGGGALRELQKLTGKDGEQLKKMFNKNPVEVLTLTLQGLQKTGTKSGESLSKLGLIGDRNIQVMGVLAANADRVTDSLKISREEWDKNTALQEESNKFFATTAQRLAHVVVKLKNFAAILGANLLPVINVLLTVSGLFLDMLQKIVSNPIGATIVALTASFAALRLVFGKVVIVKMVGYLLGIKGAVIKLTKAVTTMKVVTKLFMGPTGWLILGITAISAAITALVVYWDEFVATLNKAKDAALEFLGVSGAMKEREIKQTEEQIEKVKELTDAEIARQEKLREQALLSEEVLKQLDEVKKERDKLNFEEKALRDEQSTSAALLKLKTENEAHREFLDQKNKGQIAAWKHEKKQSLEQNKFKKLLNSLELKSATTLANTLLQLESQGLIKSKAIRKSVGISNTLVHTATAIMKTMSEVPWPLNIAQAISTGVMGAVQIAKIASARSGGIVGPQIGRQGANDVVPIAAHAGEAIVPNDLVPQLRNATESINNQSLQENEGSMIDININEDASDFITANQRERENLGFGVQPRFA